MIRFACAAFALSETVGPKVGDIHGERGVVEHGKSRTVMLWHSFCASCTGLSGCKSPLRRSGIVLGLPLGFVRALAPALTSA
ncbi:hypothetical protein [Mesorhizobium sp.]|uniref:hypothetical protein n=1 Tax=Mesorhizobium sp. TaxID=1871066 RepID=UPI001201B024|nr:hypothetical protein [Mesorhizobium sp.]TIO12296.1 MAG: hypothetical protein E5X86_33925 [Mesorhizobium sp.]